MYASVYVFMMCIVCMYMYVYICIRVDTCVPVYMCMRVQQVCVLRMHMCSYEWVYYVCVCEYRCATEYTYVANVYACVYAFSMHACTN